ncbi:hypothetical protein [Nocardia carnea]|uniref:hypothetical protein n=1 Tax=Nocardia carnea TaxID=37328 RepID=UPI002458AFAF|nr:hypothetical protein [Nocardia carnea]
MTDQRSPAPWIAAGLSMFSLVVVVVVAATLLLSPDEAPAAYQDNPPTSTEAKAPQKYTVSPVENACEVVDFDRLASFGQGRKGEPDHTETDTGVTGALHCMATFEKGSMLLSAQLASTVRESYDTSENSKTSVAGSGRRSGPLPGLGADAYFSLSESNTTQWTSITAEVGVIDDNLFLTLSLSLSGSGVWTTGDDVLRAVEEEVRRAMDRMES